MSLSPDFVYGRAEKRPLFSGNDATKLAAAVAATSPTGLLEDGNESIAVPNETTPRMKENSSEASADVMEKFGRVGLNCWSNGSAEEKTGCAAPVLVGFIGQAR
jgi:hypothetical protein